MTITNRKIFLLLLGLKKIRGLCARSKGDKRNDFVKLGERCVTSLEALGMAREVVEGLVTTEEFERVLYGSGDILASEMDMVLILS